MATFVTGLIVALVKGWQLTLVTMSVTPLIFAAGFLMAKSVRRAATSGQAHYAQAGQVADEILRLIRTIIAFDTQEQVGGWGGGEEGGGVRTVVAKPH